MFLHFSYFESNFFCEPCQLSKHCRSIYPINNNSKSYIPFSLVHYDAWGPSSTNSLFGFSYFVTFVDDCSCSTWVYLLKHRSDVCATFKSFHIIVNTSSTPKLKFCDLIMVENIFPVSC